MKVKTVTMVRIYILESSGLLKKIKDYLMNESEVKGVSVYRAITGFGPTTHHEHTTSLVDLSIDLPLTLEFFDVPENVKVAITELRKIVKAEHIVMWEAKAIL